ncbi:XkdX family protein [Bacillus inaquosorum]|uniref:XkdX family protein n=1 Tax=Bacillus inaquosorum TaxID=483913 RepID=UPI002282C426|nr:XkdX family protein [Bacillus inaquosorum]MCY9060988.1 XkdX family protein [Bacillus inaquosorum]
MAASYPEMSDIKLFYSWGCYTDDDIRTYVEIGWITEAQFTEVTGKPYSAEAPIEETSNVETGEQGA